MAALLLFFERFVEHFTGVYRVTVRAVFGAFFAVSPADYDRGSPSRVTPVRAVTLRERKVTFDHHYPGGRGVEMNVRSVPAFRRFLRNAADIVGVVVVVCLVAWVMLWAAFTL
jgi:hypothetical protein